ncbi:MAG: hypothetical protein GXP05_10445 [Alphaproteobacteria bacterium]|nr:hypothetical protein [Alphaproteobacteria bacterium]
MLDPHHSRPIDVHRWSDHPEVRALINDLWDRHFQPWATKSTRGPKPKTRHKDQLKVLLLDLYVAWTTDPELAIGVHLNNSEWRTNSRYNALHLSKVIVEYVHHLAELGLIDLSPGSFSGPGAMANRNARIRAATPLQALFHRAKFGLGDIGHSKDRECVILRGEDGKPIEYEDTVDTRKMRRKLRTYNDRLARTFVDIPTLDQPFVDRAITTGPRAGRVQRLPIGPSNQFVRRVFSRGRWDLNGRYYGGWWQQIDSELRKQIHINDVPMVEVDYRAQHINILSIEAGAGPIEGDPYDLTEGYLEGVDRTTQRKYLKYLALTAINAKDRTTAFRAFRDNYPKGDPGKRFTNDELDRILEEFVRRTPQLRPSLFADQGIRLMHIDSQIAERVLRWCAIKDLPVLCVHDSFIIDYNHSLLLKLAMSLASKAVLGVSLAVSQNFVGLDDLEGEKLRADYVEVRALERTKGYLERKKVIAPA